jgi:hypothetical protein
MNYNNDEALRNLVKDYDDKCKEYFSITYVGIAGSAGSILSSAGIGIVAGPIWGAVIGAFSNDFGIMTADDECLRIYVLRNNCLKLCAENVEDVIVLYYDTFIKLKIKKFLIWNDIKIHFMFECESKPRKIKIVVADVKKQREHVKKLIDFLKEFKKNQLDF